MRLAGARVHIHGRLRGVTQRRIAWLAARAGARITRRGTGAKIIVLGHRLAATSLSDSGALMLGFEPLPTADVISEDSFKRLIGLAPEPESEARAYSLDQLMRLSD